MAKKRVKAGTSKAAAAARRALFVEAYCTNGRNATQAAKTAGFSPKSAERQGLRLTSDVRVSTAVEKRLADVLAVAQERCGKRLGAGRLGVGQAGVSIRHGRGRSL